MKDKDLTEILDSLKKKMDRDFAPTEESIAFDSRRTKDNEELIKTLSRLSQQNPSLRFSQLLSVFGFVSDDDFEKPKYWKNEFYAEPGDVLLRVTKTLDNRSLKAAKK